VNVSLRLTRAGFVASCGECGASGEPEEFAYGHDCEPNSFTPLSEIDTLQLDGVENLRAIADCLACGLPFDLADMHDCEVSDV
jgi:hypothetical protein